MGLAIIAAIILAFAFGREWILVKASGWQRLSQKYRCTVPFKGNCHACWWVQFTTMGRKRRMVVNVGRLIRWPFRIEFPRYWIGAASEGLYLKRNVWNFLHPALLIPWPSIQSASEVTYADLLRNSSPASALVSRPMELHPFIAAAQGIGGPLLELKISAPDVSIVAQLVAFELALPFLQSKLTTQRQVERSSVSNVLRLG
jgi:hypothetical protein